ncbi:MAG: hypothetical protein HYV09_08015 [Deltaproteobacteria bacterium]|nr:hypothetical protein [Deltaproteobacteria bacterium]
MATDRDWADAYRAQARADFGAALLAGTQFPSAFAMLLQMTFEKFGKAALLRSGAIALTTARTSHKAASRMIATMRLQRGLMAAMGGPYAWHAAFEVVEALENAHPQLAGRAPGTPQLEYPWETATGAIQWPERDLDIAARLANPRSGLAAHVVDFATKLDRHFDAIFL